MCDRHYWDTAEGFVIDRLVGSTAFSRWWSIGFRHRCCEYGTTAAKITLSAVLQGHLTESGGPDHSSFATLLRRPRV